jgi:hypothetical protein
VDDGFFFSMIFSIILSSEAGISIVVDGGSRRSEIIIENH